jgi:hypothetical protein
MRSPLLAAGARANSPLEAHGSARMTFSGSTRREYWKFFTRAVLFHRRAFPEAMTLAIIGYHFRRVASAL